MLRGGFGRVFLIAALICRAPMAHEAREFIQRWTSQEAGAARSSIAWQLIHVYERSDEVEDVLFSAMELELAIEDFQAGKASAKEFLELLERFKAETSRTLESKDPVIRSFAAIEIGIVGEAAGPEAE